MKIDANIHAQSFVPGMETEEHDTLPSASPLGLSGMFTFSYTYPLSRKATFEHLLTQSHSAQDILEFARQDYEAIYAAEDNPGEIPGMLNRARSEGPYGIWGHHFSDLYFEGININGQAIDFEMGS